METDLIEPVEAYKCLVCNKMIYGSLTEAEKHAKMPVDENPLPEGLVLREKFGGDEWYHAWFHVVLGKGELLDHKKDHIIYQSTASFDREGFEHSIDGDIDSRELKDKLKTGVYDFINEDDYMALARWHNIPKINFDKIAGYCKRIWEVEKLITNLDDYPDLSDLVKKEAKHL